MLNLSGKKNLIYLPHTTEYALLPLNESEVCLNLFKMLLNYIIHFEANDLQSIGIKDYKYASYFIYGTRTNASSQCKFELIKLYYII